MKKKIKFLYKIATDIASKNINGNAEDIYNELIYIVRAIKKGRFYITPIEWRNTPYGHSFKVQMGYIKNNSYIRVKYSIYKLIHCNKNRRISNEYVNNIFRNLCKALSIKLNNVPSYNTLFY